MAVQDEVSDSARDVLDAVSNAVLVLDAQSVVLFANIAAGTMFRAERGTLCGKPLVELVRPGDRARYLNQLASFTTDATANAESACFEAVASRERGEFTTKLTLRRTPGNAFDHTLVVATLHEEAAGPLVAATDAAAVHVTQPVRSSPLLHDSGSVDASVDHTGRITAVNEAWRKVAFARGATPATVAGVGVDYLAVCARSEEPSALLVAQGIRDVLSRKKSSFTQIYGCHAPLKEAWFRVVVKPIDGHRTGAMISHRLYHG